MRRNAFEVRAWVGKMTAGDRAVGAIATGELLRLGTAVKGDAYDDRGGDPEQEREGAADESADHWETTFGRSGSLIAGRMSGVGLT